METGQQLTLDRLGRNLVVLERDHGDEKKEEPKSVLPVRQTNQYRILSNKPISTGSFSTVVQISMNRRMSTMNRKSLVAKIMTLKEEGEDVDPDIRPHPVSYEEAAQEVKTLRLVQNHEKVVRLKTAFIYGKEAWIVMENIPLTLHHVIYNESVAPLQIDAVATIARDLLEGLVFLKSKKVIHMDIKPANILMSRDGRSKFCDFGLAREVESEDETVPCDVTRGSNYYIAPEIIFGTHADTFDYLADVWSLGVVMHEVFTGGANLFSTFSRANTAGNNAFSYEYWFEYRKSNVAYQKALFGVEGVDYQTYPEELETLRATSPEEYQRIHELSADHRNVFAFLREALAPLPKEGPASYPTGRQDTMERSSAEALLQTAFVTKYDNPKNRKDITMMVKSMTTKLSRATSNLSRAEPVSPGITL